jgi:hypothetical protein
MVGLEYANLHLAPMLGKFRNRAGLDFLGHALWTMPCLNRLLVRTFTCG